MEQQAVGELAPAQLGQEFVGCGGEAARARPRARSAAARFRRRPDAATAARCRRWPAGRAPRGSSPARRRGSSRADEPRRPRRAPRSRRDRPTSRARPAAVATRRSGRSPARHRAPAGCAGAGSGRSGEARPRQARQNGVKTLNGSPPSVFTSHGSNSRLAFRLSAATSAGDEGLLQSCITFARALVVDAVPVDRLGVALRRRARPGPARPARGAGSGGSPGRAARRPAPAGCGAATSARPRPAGARPRSPRRARRAARRRGPEPRPAISAGLSASRRSLRNQTMDDGMSDIRSDGRDGLSPCAAARTAGRPAPCAFPGPADRR